MRNQKIHSRRPTRHSVSTSCRVVKNKDFTLVADRVENLSTYGMLVSPADPCLTGERVYVSFRIPGTEQIIDTSAHVTRVIHGRRPGESSRKLGLEFDDLSHYERYQIRKALKDRPLAPPGPRPGRRRTKFEISSLVSSPVSETA